MTLLQIFLIVTSVVILIIGYDFLKNRRLSAFQGFILFVIAVFIVIFTFNQNILNSFGQIFGVQRGADALVYISIIILGYLVLFLINKLETEKQNVTRLVREIGFLEFKIRNENKKG